MDLAGWWNQIQVSIRARPEIWGWSAGLSVVTLVGAMILVPVFLVALPADYFTRDRRHPRAAPARHPVLRMAGLIVKNLAGAVLAVAGLAMLVLPGQGLLTLMAALVLLDFPGKFRLERRLMSIGLVRRPVQALRRRLGRPPFELEAPAV